MNIRTKYIWSTYILLWLYFIFFDSSYNQEDHILTYLIFGWIPFLILYSLWVSSPKVSVAASGANQAPTNPINIDTYLDVKNNQEEKLVAFKKEYKLLLKVVNFDELNKIRKDHIEAAEEIEFIRNNLNTLFKTVGKDENFFEDFNNLFTLPPQYIKTYLILTDTKHILLAASNYYLNYEQLIVEINEDLKNGLGVKDAKIKYVKKHNKLLAKLASDKIAVEFSKAGSDEIITQIDKGESLLKTSIPVNDILDRMAQNNSDLKEMVEKHKQKANSK
jgi:hypothetical protein